MVGRAEILRYRLDRIKNILNAVEIALIIHIPTTGVLSIIDKLGLTAIIALLTSSLILLVNYMVIKRMYSKLFEEWA